MGRLVDEELRDLRNTIDHIDEHVLRLLARRLALAEEIAKRKAVHGEPVVQPDRAQQVRTRYLQLGVQWGLRPSFLEALWELLHSESCHRQSDVLRRLQRHVPG
ncbi:chorismate mutase [Alicyclobacillus vulcanalis]|uniref:Chorismate mutase/chorismate mutase / prephenate dehydrogenase n=1 Tax=Alicyclobacillus vulcanalis TaxID=252246 RepID=A0A1N7K3K0_9BACL|nr:chorismate mutase [Alicyclobacillus vulcanalis]SIS56024.1 chorismate mutase/chorismate mutase / prephenate dehydrogenase [Alicyclobacillus vulcanalis]